MKIVLEFKIELDEIYEVKSSSGTVTMILFHGSCNCENFRGKVLPGAVDTQLQRKDGSKSLCAKYILEGTDKLGCKCRIFVENQGIVQSDTSLIETKPIIITDSAALKWLENSELSGIVEQEQKYIVIKIYSK